VAEREIAARDRRAIFNTLSADQMESLLAWFVESYTDGWRPNIFVSGVTQELYVKSMGLLAELNSFHRRMKRREEERDH
jgi:hypothetical protein